MRNGSEIMMEKRDMNNELISELNLLDSIVNAYEELKTDVINKKRFQEAMRSMVEMLFEKNSRNFEKTHRCKKVFDIGDVQIGLTEDRGINSLISRKFGAETRDNWLSIPIEIDFQQPVCIFIEDNEVSEVTIHFTERILYHVLSEFQNMELRCIDVMSGGKIYGNLLNPLTKMKKRTGGLTIQKEMEMDDILKELENISISSMAAVGGDFPSVQEYNKENPLKQLPEILCVLCAEDLKYGDTKARIKKLMDNHRRNGISFFVVSKSETVQYLDNTDALKLKCSDNKLWLAEAKNLCIRESKFAGIRKKDVDSLVAEYVQAQHVDTSIEKHINSRQEYFQMDSTYGLKIPFAVDDNNHMQYFELGGDSPVHALISGTTGSGKSVTLHTLIIQIIKNYHPDDVEIWAVDYKAVEFAQYVNKRTPHFRVIAQDDSEEFSISLVKLLNEEYNRRKRIFVEANVKSISEYREKFDRYSMPRIVVVIDEFQHLTQAVQNYSGNRDYRIILENLLKLTRITGISFIFCSQTIASGLSGLTDSARDQIGSRLSMYHNDDAEIRETLILKSSDMEILKEAQSLQTGQAIMRCKMTDPENDHYGIFQFKKVHVLYIPDEVKDQIIDAANEKLAGNYTPKAEIIIRNSGRIQLDEKPRHPLTQFVYHGKKCEEENELVWYPAAPITLDDQYSVKMERESASNILVVGENDALRDSIAVISVCGYLLDKESEVVVCIVDEAFDDRKRLGNLLKNIKSKRLTTRIGIDEVLNELSSMRKIRPLEHNRVYLWYGLDKLKNEIFLKAQDEEDDGLDNLEPEEKEEDVTPAASFLNLLNTINSSDQAVKKETSVGQILDFEECGRILRRAFEMGPENGYFNFCIFNNLKSMRALLKLQIIALDDFEQRIGMRMSLDDSYDLFGSSLAINKANDMTVIHYSGSGRIVPLKPYLMPDASWFEAYNKRLKEMEV